MESNGLIIRWSWVQVQLAPFLTCGPMERNLGEQPIARILSDNNLTAANLVAASTEDITFKMVSRACKGRRLTPHVQIKICNALNNACDKSFTTKDLFNY